MLVVLLSCTCLSVFGYMGKKHINCDKNKTISKNINEKIQDKKQIKKVTPTIIKPNINNSENIYKNNSDRNCSNSYIQNNPSVHIQITHDDEVSQ